MRRLICGAMALLMLSSPLPAMAWGFYGHRLINRMAVFLLPPEMMILYKPQQGFLMEHAVDPDKRRYIVKEEGPRHYMDMDHYQPWDSIPASWSKAIEKYGEDSLYKHGIAPWWIQIMMGRLTRAFEKKDKAAILKLSADLGHYIADIHVPLHASSNHNGQHTGQNGIHGFWESRIPELFAEEEFDFFIGKANYLPSVSAMAWRVIRESAKAADTVLSEEKRLNGMFAQDGKYAFEERNGLLVRQYSSAYSKIYHRQLRGMVERRMRASIQMVANCWYTAWVNAGQPDLRSLAPLPFTPADEREWENMNQQWKEGAVKGRSCTN
ncbi:MAG: S1/P1 Nuclease [Sphingobacteriales bacterium]|nr:MAG: S1/P1 Nuclease [Sphingobacteriales bacterium]